MLLNFISIVVSLLSFSEIFTNLVILLKRSHSLSIQLIWLALHNDRDFCILRLYNLLMSYVYDPSSSNRTSMLFSDLQGVLNAQFQTVSFLLTIIFLCLRILSYSRAICWYSDLIDLARSG